MWKRLELTKGCEHFLSPWLRLNLLWYVCTWVVGVFCNLWQHQPQLTPTYSWRHLLCLCFQCAHNRKTPPPPGPAHHDPSYPEMMRPPLTLSSFVDLGPLSIIVAALKLSVPLETAPLCRWTDFTGTLLSSELQMLTNRGWAHEWCSCLQD